MTPGCHTGNFAFSSPLLCTPGTSLPLASSQPSGRSPLSGAFQERCVSPRRTARLARDGRRKRNLPIFRSTSDPANACCPPTGRSRFARNSRGLAATLTGLGRSCQCTPSASNGAGVLPKTTKVTGGDGCQVVWTSKRSRRMRRRLEVGAPGIYQFTECTGWNSAGGRPRVTYGALGSVN
jgi:hypothetical protein